jgi:serine/threonine-protein kinase
VRIHDLVVEDGRLAIVMDLVNGPDLHRHLIERGVLSLPDAAVIGRGVASALTAIHAAGIIHRDLKPANILLDLGGPQPQPKLVDFGIARMIAGSRLTARSSVVGTPQYLSPEAIRGAEPSPALDIYAFGIALYELLCGKPPFSGDQLLQVLNQHMYQEPPWPASIPPEILPLLQAMLAKNPESRPTALDLSHEMDALVAAAGPIDPPQPASPAEQQPAQQSWQPAAPQPGGYPAADPNSPIPAPALYPAQHGQAPFPAAQGPSPYPGQSGPTGPNSPIPQGSTPYGAGPVPNQPSPYPQQPYGAQSPVPGQGQGTPLPGGYGSPGQSPLPAPSPSGFFYPGREMLDGPGGPDGGGVVFGASPPPFTEDMFAARKPKRGWRKPLLIAGPVVAVLVIAGLVFALTSGNKNSPQPVAGASTSSTASHTTAVVALPACPTDEAPVGIAASARWTLSGTAADCSVAPASTNSLTLAHGARWTTSSSRGQVLDLPAAGGVATVPNSGFVNTANSFTLSIWVYLDEFTKNRYSTVMILQGNSIDAFRLEYNPGWGGWAFNYSDKDSPSATLTAAATRTPPTTKAWTHLVAIYDSAAKTATLYVNGKQVAQTTNVVGWDATAQVALGSDIYQNGNTYDGMTGDLSNLQIFDSALTANQVASLQ